MKDNVIATTKKVLEKRAIGETIVMRLSVEMAKNVKSTAGGAS